MRWRSALFCSLLALSLCTPRLHAQAAESRILPALLGGVAGVAGGGYIAVSIVVLESRFGRYIHDVNDILGWRSFPVLAGATIGATLGALDPDRLVRTVALGAVGFGGGGLIGLGIGELMGETKEARWAGFAIGAGAGLIVGNLLGIILPADTGPGQVGTVLEARVPVNLRFNF